MLLFKNGIKQLFKDWLQFLIYLILISIGVLFTSAFGIVSANLVRTNSQISRNFKGYDYSYKFTSSSYSSNDTQTISPFFAFSNDYVTDGQYSFPTLTIGNDKDSVLLPFNFVSNLKDDGTSNYDSYLYKYEDKNSSKIYLLNFGFGDTEGYKKDKNASKYSYTPTDNAILNLTNEEKINNFVAKKEFGRFFRFNENSNQFKNSLIGQLYAKNNNFIGELNNSQKKVALDIFDYMFYLNNSPIMSAFKSFIIDNVIINNIKDKDLNEKVNQFVNNSSENIKYQSIDDFKKYGFNGRIGNTYVETNPKTDEDTIRYFITDEDSLLMNSGKLWDNKTLKDYGSFLLKNYESKDFFSTKNSPSSYFIDDIKFLKAKDFFNSYYDLLSDLTNFDITYTNEVVMWDVKGKYRFISAFSNYIDPETGKKHGKFNNEDLYTVYEQDSDKDDYLTQKTFMTTYGYYKNNNLSLGEEYQLIPKDAILPGQSVAKDGKARLDAVGVDALNIYPTIYDEDILANQVNDAIYYINSDMYKDFFNDNDKGESLISNTKYQDVSKAYMKYNGNPKDMESSINLYKLFAADNVLKIGDVSKKIGEYLSTSTFDEKFDYSVLTRLNPKSFKETKVFNMRSGFFGQASSIFLLVSFLFCIILLSVILFITYNLTKKFLNAQRGQIGNLKALGVRKTKIIMNFILYLSLPIIIMVPIGWGLSIAMQRPLMNIFGIYFNVPIVTIIDWKFLLVEWFIFGMLAILLIWFISYKTVKKDPLTLMQPSRGNKPNITLTKFFNRFSFVKFTNKIRGSLIALSVKDLFIFSFVIFVSTTILTVSASIPNALSTMSTEYYNAINYNNDYSYTNIVNNNPFTKFNWRETNGSDKEFNYNNSLFSAYKKTSDNKYLTTLNEEGWSNNKDDYHRLFESIIKYKALGLNGYLFSPGIMQQIVNTSRSVYGSKNNPPTEQVKQISCKILPTLFNQPPIDDANMDYQDCIKSMTNNIIPSVIKQKWEDEPESFQNFAFNFNLIPYNLDEDEIYTNIKARDDKKVDFKIYGLNKDTTVKNINLERRDLLYNENDSINVSINETMKLKGYDVGKVIKMFFDVEELEYKANNNSYANINDNFVWKYDGKEINVNEMDLGHFAFAPTEEGNQSDQLYYYEDGEYKKYNDLGKLSLTIKDTSKFDSKVFQGVNEEYLNVSGNKLNNSNELTFNPFDVRKYENGKPVDIGLTDLMSGTNSWWNIALENELIKTELTTKSIDATVVKVEKVYDSPKIYMDQVKLNKAIGYPKYDSYKIDAKNSKINIWSNAKLSKNIEPIDKYNRSIVKFKNWNNATANADRYLVDAIGFTDYINLKKAATNDLIKSVASISVVFITISMIVGIIIIYVITDLFVGKYKNFMNYMRVQGYSLGEINSIIMWIFLPLTLLFAALAIGMTAGLMFGLVPRMLLSIEIAIPLMIKWWVFVSILGVSIAIFSIAYIIILKSLFRVKLASLTGISNN
ncbi:ABC transporter permease [Spiroplasma litorale]|uniref:ABC transporter permease n=1 Tax=Spiroplasma litorale TaxID=216942 RepID=A0A0K1W2R2_9MOLU|nr:ABC transporter permease [Spiroplasma litorale]AKX34615.1 ABC transporter permease [Spiroplasma litorale]